MSVSSSQPQHVGPYRLIEKIGEGGMGVVHLAVSPDGGLAAVKVLRPWLVGGEDARRRFEKEFAALHRVRGHRVAAVLDADVDGDLPYIATRYVRGSSLDKVVGDHGPLQGRALMRLADGLAEAVATVHDADVVHRDIKPGNVMMTDNGPVLIDFGLARAIDETRLTATGMVIGTPGYLAPEVVAGGVPQPPADVHGWAATVAFAATGRPPYGAGPAAVVLDRIRRGDLDIDDVEPGLASVLKRALVADPAARPTITTVRAMLAEPDAAGTTAFGVAAGAAAAAAPRPSNDQAATDQTVTNAAATDPNAPPAANHQNGESPTVTSAATAYARPTRIQEVPLPAADREAPTAPGTDTVPGGPTVPAAPSSNGRAASPARKPRRPATLGPDGIAPPLATWPARLALVTGAAALVVLLGVSSGFGLVVLFALLVTGRTTWRVRRSLYQRRVARGYQPRDNMATAAGTPWYVLVSSIPSFFQVVLLGGVGYVIGTAVALSPDAGPRGPFVVAAIVIVALAWVGPATSKVRHGIRALAAPLDRNTRTGWIAAGVLFAIAWILALIWESYPTTWPIPEFLDFIVNELEQTV